MRGSWLYKKNSSRAVTRFSKGVLDWEVSSDWYRSSFSTAVGVYLGRRHQLMNIAGVSFLVELIPVLMRGSSVVIRGLIWIIADVTT